MRKVRHGIFETNSSSAHCICINSATETPMFPKHEFYTHKDGKISIYEDELSFGRGFQIIYSCFGKTLYAIASFDKDRFKEIESIFGELYNATNPEVRFTGFDMPHGWGDEDEELFYGDIDHQSIGLLQSFLTNNNISLRDFISDPKYVVITDGDEYLVFYKLKQAGFLPTLEEIER